MSETNAITIWRYEDAPDALRRLSTHGGDEDWLAVVPRSLYNPPSDWPSDEYNSTWLPAWMWEGQPFGYCGVNVYPHPDSAEYVVVIGAHA